jgi:hypothetical protein
LRNRAALGLVVLLVMGACSGDEKEPASTTAAAAAPTPKEDPVCPHTGRAPAKGVDLGRAAVAVKVENSPAARPQSGLEKADLVLEEIV